MNQIFKNVSIWCQSCLWVFAMKIASVFKISFIIGSSMAFFSAFNIIAPLAGAFGGVAHSILIVGLGIMGSLLSGKVLLSHLVLSYHIPTFFASAYWYSGAPIRLFLPLLCMLLFVTHPTGMAAWVYSLYWLIPIVIYFSKRNSVFLNALGSTFIAHAVGSVIWLYTIPMLPAQWLALMPIVALERFAFALGMVVVHYGITYMIGVFKTSTMPNMARIFSETTNNH